MGTSRSKTAPTTVKALANREKALQLRRSGLSFERIGAAIGVTRQAAHQMVKVSMEHARSQISASADELRAEEVSRLDGMLEAVWKKAIKGDVQAIDRVLKIGERRAKLLGLDAPVRTALQGGGDDAPPIVSEARVTFYMPNNGRD